MILTWKIAREWRSITLNNLNLQRPEDWLKNFTHEVASGEFVLESVTVNRSYSQCEASFKFHAASHYLVFVPKTHRQFVYGKAPGGLFSAFYNGGLEDKVLFNWREIEKYRLKNYEWKEVHDND